MMRSVKLLTWLSLSNFLGFNEARYSKDKRKKNQILIVGIAYLVLAVMLVFYAGLITYALILMNMEEIIPAYLAVVISLLSFMFTVFSAGPTLFNVKSYEFLIVLPVRPSAIVISRFLSMYLIDMLISVMATASVLVVCGIMGISSPWFYIAMALASLFIPLLPMTAAMIVGTGIYAITSRMRRKNIMQILFSMTFLALYFLFMQNLNGTDEEIVNAMSDMIHSMTSIYPPAAWFSDGAHGHIPMYLLFLAVSLLIFFAFAAAVGKFFKPLCTSLVSQAAKRNYVMKEQKSTNVFRACFFRERKRYFASSLYVMNTLVAYIMAIILSLLLLFSDTGKMLGMLPADMIAKAAPFVLAMICNLSPTTVSAFSMEGKHFWLTQSLPLKIKDIIHAKLLVNLMMAIPSALVSSGIILFIFRPTGLYILWLILIPLLYAFFGSILGLWINMKMPMMSWDNEAQVVKQSKAVLMMMLCGFVSELVPLIAVLLTSGIFVHIAMLSVVLLISGLMLAMYRNLLSMKLNALLEK
ncbi:MAG: hypothetical protein IJ489_02465 [Clostridia bacterium]|nr:hypothetical protein [Clostridia bacterium]